MIAYKPGDVVLLRFPFTDGSGDAKQRPALVLLDAGDLDVVVARITTQKYSTKHDVVLHKWFEAGLIAASTVRLHKLATLEKALVVKHLGQLAADDCDEVAKVLLHLFPSFS